MANSTKFRFNEWLMDISDTLNYDKEAMLESLVEQTGLPPEEFGVYFILEEYPLVFTTISNVTADDNLITVSQQFRVRPKTPEEMQLAIEGVKDGINKP